MSADDFLCTVLVDELGNPVTVDVVKSGVPVTVFYPRQATSELKLQPCFFWNWKAALSG